MASIEWEIRIVAVRQTKYSHLVEVFIIHLVILLSESQTVLPSECNYETRLVVEGNITTRLLGTELIKE